MGPIQVKPIQTTLSWTLYILHGLYSINFIIFLHFVKTFKYDHYYGQYCHVVHNDICFILFHLHISLISLKIIVHILYIYPPITPTSALRCGVVFCNSKYFLPTTGWLHVALLRYCVVVIVYITDVLKRTMVIG